jgi:hypothetical protein
MNTTHYPSLELCKRLTCNWFPETEKWEYYPDIDTYLEKPSIAELLDELPTSIKEWWKYLLGINWVWTDKRQFNVRYETVYWSNKIWFQDESLPNALTEMWLWLKENNYLPK